MKKLKESYAFKLFLAYFIVITVGVICTIINIAPNSDKLNVITYTNDNEGYHPKVLAFDNKWNGYKYWMAFTPYKNADSSLENPSINVSNDMINWSIPEGLINPLDKTDVDDKEHYNSDTHLVYNSETNNLEIFWRYVDDTKNEVIIYKMTSSDGVNWSEKEEFLVSSNRTELDYVSPAIIYDDGIYKIWYVDKKAVYYIEKKDDSVSEPLKMNVKYNSTLYTWHIDVIKNGDKYEMVMVSYANSSNRKTMDLYYSSSNDNLNWSTPEKILVHSKDGDAWDSQGLYRSSILYDNDKYYIFYSGHNSNKEVGIGLVCGEKIDNLKNCNK